MHSLKASIQQTVRDFRAETSEWEDRVRSLFDDVDQFLASSGPDAQPPRTMAGNVAENVVSLKGLVEQQTEVLSALVDALTTHSVVARSVGDGNEQQSGQSESELDPFERLQQVVAAASGAC